MLEGAGSEAVGAHVQERASGEPLEGVEDGEQQDSSRVVIAV